MALDPFTADIRADVYTLGCVLYHALAGRPPYDDPTPVGQMIRHATEPPLPLRESAPEVPEPLERIVLRMMARSPERRYATPDEAAEALAGYLAGNTVAPGHEVEGEVAQGAPAEEATTPWEPTPGTISVELVLPPAPPESVWESVAAADPPTHASTKDVWLNGRDCWLLVAGGVGVLLAQFLGWMIAVLSAIRAGS
jgi:serine/threonine protein kinase